MLGVDDVSCRKAAAEPTWALVLPYFTVAALARASLFLCQMVRDVPTASFVLL